MATPGRSTSKSPPKSPGRVSKTVLNAPRRKLSQLAPSLPYRAATATPESAPQQPLHPSAASGEIPAALLPETSPSPRQRTNEEQFRDITENSYIPDLPRNLRSQKLALPSSSRRQVDSRQVVVNRAHKKGPPEVNPAKGKEKVKAIESNSVPQGFNQGLRRGSPQSGLVEERTARDTAPRMTSRINRQARGGQRGGDNNLAEEQSIYADIKSEVLKITRLAERSEELKQDQMDLEAEIHRKKCLVPPQEPSIQEMTELDVIIREQLRVTEEIELIGRTGEDNTIQKILILKAMVEANESERAESQPRRATNARDGVSRPQDLDGATDSPVASPMGDKPNRKDRFGTSSARGSLPPREAPIKVEGGDAGASGIELNAKGKIIFALGAEVAFRPKATGSEEPDWIQGTVVKVIGEGKSRRYDVQDPEPDEAGKPGQIYRTSASSMVTIPPLGQPLGDYPRGKAVLARYPDTTTFYRAEVVGMNGSMVNLKFEGEEDERTTEVDRRFVLDHRG